MDIKFITLQISARIYWGYQYKVPYEYAISVSKEALIEEIKIDMKNFFTVHNLEELKEGVDNLHLHIHQDIQSSQEVVFVCQCA